MSINGIESVAGAACAEAADLDDGTDAGELALTPIFSCVCVEYVDGPLGDWFKPTFPLTRGVS